jgi:hypothetical protein
MKSKQTILLEGCIATINNQIEILRNAGIELHDGIDYDYVLDYIRYSTASDTFTFNTKQSEISEDAEIVEVAKREEMIEYRRAV